LDELDDIIQAIDSEGEPIYMDNKEVSYVKYVKNKNSQDNR
jgi:hypothetical protein